MRERIGHLPEESHMLTKEKSWELVRFFISGGAAITVSYSLLYTLTEYVHMRYWASDIISVAVNYTMTFFFHKYWTYRDRTTYAIRRQIRVYGFMVTGFYISNIIMEPLLVEYVHLHYLVAQVVISAVLTVVSLLITPRLFNPKPPTAC